MERVSQHPVLPVAVVPIVLAIKVHHRGRPEASLRHRCLEAAVDSEEVDPPAEELLDQLGTAPVERVVGTLVAAVGTVNLPRQDRLVPI